jgi:acyl-CoA thioesterase-1
MMPIISRSARGFLVVAALLGVGCGGPARPEPEIPAAPAVQPSPAAEPAADAVRIVVLGDSLAAGMGLPEARAFPAVAERMLREAGHAVEMVNAGVSGDTTAGGLTRIDWVLRQQPQLLVVELGGNDALRGQPLENTERNLREIIRRGRAAGARVLLLGMDVPSNYGPDYGEAFAAIYERLAREEEGVTLVPGFVRGVGVDPSLMQADGLHPTAEGQRRLAETLVPYLEDALDELATASPSL